MNQYDNHIYLDAAATTPPLSVVVRTVSEIQRSYWGNPSSINRPGIMAREILERSRLFIADKLETTSEEVIFTSGASESVSIALGAISNFRNPGRIVLSAIEHPCVYAAARELIRFGWNVVELDVDNNGVVELNKLESYLSYPTQIVSVISSQNEIGTIQPLEQIGNMCRDRNIIFHTDATQLMSHNPLLWNRLPIDLLSCSAHKFQGPKGTGLLLVREDLKKSITKIDSDQLQESGLRIGTQAVPIIAGMEQAIDHLRNQYELLGNQQGEMYKVQNLTYTLKSLLSTIPNIQFIGHPTERQPNLICCLISDKNNQPLRASKLVRQFSKYGISVSSGSACSTRKKSPNRVLNAIGVPQQWQNSALRFSLGPWLNDEDIYKVSDILNKIINEYN